MFFLCCFRIAGKHFTGTVPAHKQNIVCVALCFRAHAGTSVRHSWNSQAESFRALLEQAPDIVSRDMSFQEVAINAAGMTGSQFDRYAQINLVLHQQGAKPLFTRDLKTVLPQVIGPLFAAFAAAALHDMDGRAAFSPG
ncbi:hypothetical protein IE00_16725 [Paracoccus sp. SM22M-07]|nr:hypothetical protein IE00_16725 [Paracoccus sp. SM22M-07]